MMPSTFPLERIGSPRKELIPCRERARYMGESSGPLMRRGRFSRKIWPARSFPCARSSRRMPGRAYPSSIITLRAHAPLRRQAHRAAIRQEEPRGGFRHVRQDVPHVERRRDRPPYFVQCDQLRDALPGVVIEPAVADRPRDLGGHRAQQMDGFLRIVRLRNGGDVHHAVEIHVVHDRDGKDRCETVLLLGNRQRGRVRLYVRVEHRYPFLGGLPGDPSPTRIRKW